jgi:hypothetical protein
VIFGNGDGLIFLEKLEISGYYEKKRFSQGPAWNAPAG